MKLIRLEARRLGGLYARIGSCGSLRSSQISRPRRRIWIRSGKRSMPSSSEKKLRWRRASKASSWRSIFFARNRPMTARPTLRRRVPRRTSSVYWRWWSRILQKTLTEIIATEEASAAEYDWQTKENEILKPTMEQDVKYKPKEAKHIDEAFAEPPLDRGNMQAELDAVLKYFAKLMDVCVAQPMNYEKRTRRQYVVSSAR